MDARGVQRLLERIYGLADTAEHVGSKSVEMMQREPRLRGETRAALAELYREHARRVQVLHSSLGLAIANAIQNDLDDDGARGALDVLRSNLQSLHDAATNQLKDTVTRL